MAQSEEWFTSWECSLTRAIQCLYQPVHNETRSFIYADDLCIATQRSNFEQIETILTEALQNRGEYYERNHLRANPDNTQICAFHLKNREAIRKLNITWYNKHLEHTPTLYILEWPWIEHWVTKSTYTNWSAKHPLGTISLGTYQKQNGEPSHQPSKQQLLHSATLRRNMRVLCGKGRNT